MSEASHIVAFVLVVSITLGSLGVIIFILNWENWEILGVRIHDHASETQLHTNPSIMVLGLVHTDFVMCLTDNYYY